MARQTRNSKRSKPGMTIDGTATEKKTDAISATGTTGTEAAKASDTGSAKATSSASASSTKPDTSATSVPSAGGGAPSGTTSGGTTGDAKATSTASASASGASGSSKPSDGKASASDSVVEAVKSSNEKAVADAKSNAPDATGGVAKGGTGASGPGKDATSAKGASSPSGSGTKDGVTEVVKKDNEKAVADARSKSGETTTGVAKGGSGATGPGKDAPKVTDRPTSERLRDGGSGRKGDNDNKTSGLIPGLIGGAVALVGAWILSSLGLFGGDDIDVVRAELDEVRGAIPAAEAVVDPATVAALDERVAQIEAVETQQAEAVLPPEVAERIDRLEAALAEQANAEPGAAVDLSAVENRLAALEAIGPSESGDNVEALEQRFAEIEQTLGTGDTEARQALQSLQARLDELASGQEATLAETATTVAGAVAAIATVRDSIDTLRSDVEALNQAVVTGDEAATGRFTDIDANLGTITNRIETLRTQIANLERGGERRGEQLSGVAANLETATTRLDDVAGRVDDLSGRTDEIASRVDTNASQLADLSATVEESRSDTTVARAIAASNLKSAIDRGTSFAPELESYAAVAAEPGEIEPLREFAGRGVPTLPELLERFDTASADIIATQYAVGEDAGVADQLGASLRSLVQVRPVGEAASGNEVGAIVTRMEDALESGDLQAVLSEGEQLPPDALAEAEPFLADVRARLTANELIDTALSRAIRPAG